MRSPLMCANLVTRAKRGFTLAELIVVLVILGLMLGVAGPAFLAASSSEDDGAAVVVGILRAAQRHAIEQGAQTEVDIELRTGRVWVRSDGPGIDTTFVLALPDGSSLGAERPRAHFWFRPDGVSGGEPVGVVTAAIRDEISVEPFTGAISRTRGGSVLP
jgi:prepilin-type N-terminal cleavage/methylation domain-containing protein